MEILATIWTITYGVLLVILGLNAVIIVHELGHFLVARWCGVRVEKFYCWMDFWGLKFFKFKWGETEYGLGLFPLGGYVKMLGQEDNPGAIQAEIARARQGNEGQVTQETVKEWTGVKALEADGLVDAKKAMEMVAHVETEPVSESQVADIAIFAPDSYLAKSVPQRLAIIVAGVTMNFFFAIVCAAGAYMVGVRESAPAVGNVIPGSPAWEAGLQTGDIITAIDGNASRAFGDVTRKMIGGSDTIQLTIERPSEATTVSVFPDEESRAFDNTTIKMTDGTEAVQLYIERRNVSINIDVVPRKRSGDLLPNIGISPLPTLELFPEQQLSGQWGKYYTTEARQALNSGTEDDPLWLEKVDGQVVNNYVEYQEAQFKKIGQTILCTFNGVDVEIPAIPMREIPIRFQMGTIASVLSGSEAARQGIRKGDTIVSVDGDADFDPLKLPQILLRKINAEQKTVELVIRKADGGKEQTLRLELKPVRILSDLSSLSMRDPLGCAALGLAWNVEPVIAEIDESALLQGQPVPAIGDRVISVEFINSARFLKRNSFSSETVEGLLIHRIGERVDVPYIFTNLLQNARLREENTGVLRRISQSLGLSKPPVKDEEKILFVRLELKSIDEKTKIVDLPILEANNWFQLERGFDLMPGLTMTKTGSISEALSRGALKTVDFTLLVYRSVNSLINGTVSPRALNGPVGIIEILYKIALSGWSEYLILLCLIGANLAVINLLPIPPLDGGHVLFLMYEGIFGRQPNEIVQVILSYFGLFLIILLMVWTVTLDLQCIPRW